MVKNRDGIIISEKDKIVDRWKEYFSEMLSSNPSKQERPGEQQDVETGEDIHNRSKSCRQKTKK